MEVYVCVLSLYTLAVVLLGIKNGSIIICSEGQLQRETMWVVG